jgi:hypothetical protein
MQTFQGEGLGLQMKQQWLEQRQQQQPWRQSPEEQTLGQGQQRRRLQLLLVRKLWVLWVLAAGMTRREQVLGWPSVLEVAAASWRALCRKLSPPLPQLKR